MSTRVWATADQLAVLASTDDARRVVIRIGDVFDLFIDVDAAQRLSNDLQDAVDELDGLAQP